MFVKLRKKIWLPIKYYLIQRGEEKNTLLRPVKEVLKAKKVAEEKLLEAQRLDQTADIGFYKGQLQIINWITYGNTEDQTD